MHWMNPTGAWALLALAAIICLYILKQRMEPIEVSSTFLWRKALASMEADRPFQKLRRNLLLFLQLLLALLLALSIMRPMTLGGETSEVLFVFDLSASMQAGSDISRLDTAVADAKRRIDGMPDGTRVSILTAGAQVAQPLARADDMLATRRALDALTAENGIADLDGALSLAFALQKELEDVQLIIYTDQALPDGSMAQPFIGKGLDNRAILSLNATSTAAVARLVNYGGSAEVSVECYADGKLVDIRSVSMEPDEIASVQFELPAPAEQVMARITDADALAADNERIWVSRETDATTIVLAGRNNVFIEKALALRQDIAVLKTTAEEAAVVATGALTVIDGPLPDTLPERGALFLIDPNSYVGRQIDTPATLEAATGPLADALNEHAQIDEIQVSQYKPVEGGTPIWLANGQPVLSIMEEDGRSVAVLGFDVHDSNLPLLKEFPVFIQRLLAYLAPEPLGAGFEDADAGSPLQIMPQSFARDAAVVSPSGTRTQIPVTGGAFTSTNELGVYRLLQTNEAGEETVIPFALHIPAAESDVRSVAQVKDQTAQTGRGASYGREWTPWLVGLLLAVMLLEWWVYRRGN